MRTRTRNYIIQKYSIPHVMQGQGSTSSKVLWAMLVGAALCVVPTVARADQALVIGINDYPSLDDGDLEGCLNDARDMGQMLQSKGFAVTTLLNEKATKAGIIGALDAMAARVKPTERFVLFYAGHGARATGGFSVLLPHDAREGEERNDIPSLSLYDKVRVIPSHSRTVLLDSCFSGAMSRGLKKKRKVRFHPRAILAGSRGNHDAPNGGDGGFMAKDLMMVSTRRDTNPNTVPVTPLRPAAAWSATLRLRAATRWRPKMNLAISATAFLRTICCSISKRFPICACRGVVCKGR